MRPSRGASTDHLGSCWLPTALATSAPASASPGYSAYLSTSTGWGAAGTQVSVTYHLSSTQNPCPSGSPVRFDFDQTVISSGTPVQSNCTDTTHYVVPTGTRCGDHTFSAALYNANDPTNADTAPASITFTVNCPRSTAPPPTHTEATDERDPPQPHALHRRPTPARSSRRPHPYATRHAAGYLTHSTTRHNDHRTRAAPSDHTAHQQQRTEHVRTAKHNADNLSRACTSPPWLQAHWRMDRGTHRPNWRRHHCHQDHPQTQRITRVTQPPRQCEHVVGTLSARREVRAAITVIGEIERTADTSGDIALWTSPESRSAFGLGPRLRTAALDD